MNWRYDTSIRSLLNILGLHTSEIKAPMDRKKLSKAAKSKKMTREDVKAVLMD